MQNKAQQLLDMAMKAGAETADVLASHSTSIGSSIRLGKQEELERSESTGIGLRVFIGQRKAVVSGSDLRSDSLSQMAERAVAIAKQAPEDKYAGLADEVLLEKSSLELDLVEPEEPSVEWLFEQTKEIEEAALKVEGITNSEGASAGYSCQDIFLLTSSGFAKGYSKSSSTLSVSVLAGEGDGMERDYAYSSARHRKLLKSGTDIGKEAAERTLKRLSPRKVATCQVPVVFDPRIARGLLGSFASAINGASVARGTSFLKEQMGASLFPSNVTITDDPHLMQALGSRPFDGEGCRSEKLEIVSEGVLKHWLLDSKSARQLEMTTNGRASRSLSGGTSPSSTNLSLSAGVLSPEALIADIKEGFYVTETFGMGINLVTGDYSQGASGFWIENGKITYPVSEVTIASTLPQMFKELIPANDVTAEYATNSPTLHVGEMVIAGS